MFEHLKKLDVSGKTAKMFIPELGTGDNDAWIELRIADDSNKQYWNTVLKVGAARAEQKARRGAKIDPQLLKKMREMDKKLFPMHVMVGWGGICDAEGNEVPFTQENAQALVDQLCESAPRVFDEIRAFAQIPSNFLEPEELDPDIENLVGN